MPSRAASRKAIFFVFLFFLYCARSFFPLARLRIARWITAWNLGDSPLRDLFYNFQIVFLSHLPPTEDYRRSDKKTGSLLERRCHRALVFHFFTHACTPIFLSHLFNPMMTDFTQVDFEMNLQVFTNPSKTTYTCFHAKFKIFSHTCVSS